VLSPYRKEVDSVMYKEGKVYVPKDNKLRAEIIRLHHDTLVGGHRGQWKTVELVTRNFWWPGVIRATRAVHSRRFLRELDEAPGGNNLYYIYSALVSLHR